jgi:filamentous hemagglutinin family protein
MSQSTFFLSAVLALAFSLTSFQVIANPIDPNPQVIAGQVEFEGLNSEAASILQQSQQAIVDYAMFNVPDGSSVQFIQPNSDATILNRITGADPSFIKGSIIANGQVFIVNPAGVAFGPDSVIRADMFMAIAGDLSNSSFLQGDLNFALTGSVENQGSLSAQRGVALLGRQVKNTGQIVAEDGFVLLASGDEVLLQPNGTNLAVQLGETSEAEKQAGVGVENLGEVDGEEIMFSAGDAFATAVRHNGVARATQSIELHSDGGRIEVGGELVAGTEDGGRIEIGGTDLGGEGAPTAASVTISESAVVDASSQGEGDGGHVVVWSDGLTEMFGGIAAVGGRSGSGGYAEVSGREVDFGYNGWNIALGAGGEFLLDPVDVVIGATEAGSIVSLLTAGTSVTIPTTSSFDAGGARISPDPFPTQPVNSPGSITIDAPIEVATQTNPATLRLISDGDIEVNASLESGQVFTEGSTAFSLEAGGNITINENIRTGISGAESQGAVLLTANGEIALNASIDSSNGPLSIRANNNISLASGNQLLTGGSGSEAGLLMEIVSDNGAVTFNGGVIQLFGDTDVYIEAEQFLNYSGSNLIGGPGTGSWNIHLPHPLGRTSVAEVGDRHQYGSLNSLNQAFYGASNGAPQDITQNHYLFASQPTIDIQAHDAEKTYGNDGQPLLGGGGFTAVSANLVDASAFGSVFTQDTLQTVLSGDVSLSSDASATTAGVGNYDIDIGGFEFPNGYVPNYVIGQFTVNPRAVTLVANTQERIYGDTMELDGTAFTVRDLGVDGDSFLPNSETIVEVVLSSANGGGTNTDLDAGTYVSDLSISQDTSSLEGSETFSAANYSFTYLPGDLVINRRAISIQANQQDKYYGDVDELETGSTAFTIIDFDADPGLPNDDRILSVDLSSLTDRDVSQVSDVYTYTDELRISGVTGNPEFNPDNYILEYLDGDYQIQARPITLTAADRSRLYGDTLELGETDFILTDRGDDRIEAPFELPNGERIDAVTLMSTDGRAGSTIDAAGTYANNIFIEVGSESGSNGFKLGNYEITLEAGEFVIEPRPVILTATGQARVYGDAMALSDTAFTVTDVDLDSVLPNGEVIDTVELISLWAIPRVFGGVDQNTAAPAGAYTDNIQILGQYGSNGFNAGNYDLTYVAGDLVVNQRAVTLTASQQERIYGDSMVLDDTAFTLLDLDGDNVLPNGEVIDTVALNSVTGVDVTTTAGAGFYADEIEITGQAGSSGFDAANYDLRGYVNGDLVVNQRAVTLTALQQERIYGDTMVLDDTAFAVTDLDGDSVLPNGEVIDTVALNSANGVDVTASSNVGRYADEIVITDQTGSGGFAPGNYDLSYVDGDLVVNQRAVTLTASQQERIYGDSMVLDDTAFTLLDLDGDNVLPNGEVIDTVALNSVTGVDVTTTADVATYADEIEITGQAGSSGFSAGNYDLSYVNGDLVVNQRAVTLTALQQERIYGDAMVLDETAFTVTDFDGDSVLPNGEMVDTVALNSVNAIDTTTTANVGGYGDELEITGQSGSNGFNAGNYDLTYVAGDLVVNQRAVTLTALQQERIYGDTMVLDDTAFTVTDLDGDSVLPNGEVIDTVALNSANGVDVTASSNVGRYADEIEIIGQAGSNGFSAGNYDLSYVTGDLVVNQRAVTLTALQQERIYGDAMLLNDTAFTVTDLDGDSVLPNGEVIDTVALNSVTGVDVTTTSNVGAYAGEIEITGQAGSNGFSASNYDLSYVTGDLVVNQRAVTLTASQQERIYGDAMVLDETAFTVTDLDGDSVLPNGEVIDTVALNSVTGIDATTTANVGGYGDEIEITGQSGSNGFDAGNYDLSYVEGDLVVNQRAVTLTASQQERIYGDAMVLDEAAFTVTDLDGDSVLPNGEVIDTVALNSVTGVDVTTTSNVGTYVDEIAITGQSGSNGFSAGNYDLSYVEGDLLVNQRAVTLTASQQERIYGDTMVLDETAFAVTDLDGDSVLPNGEVVDTVALNSVTGVDVTTTSNAGTYVDEIEIVGQAGSNGFDAGNYDLTYVTGDLVVNQRSVTLTALQQERGYGTSLTFDSEAFTVLDMDGDNALPNGELIETVDLVSEGGVAQDLIAFPVRYPENLRIVDQAGTDGFLAENYDFTYVPGDLVVKGFPQGTVLFAEGSLEGYFDLLRGVSKIEAPFGLVDSPSRMATMLLYGYPEWEKLSAASRKWVLAMIDLTPDEKLTEQYLLFLVRQAVNEG